MADQRAFWGSGLQRWRGRVGRRALLSGLASFLAPPGRTGRFRGLHRADPLDMSQSSAGGRLCVIHVTPIVAPRSDRAMEAAQAPVGSIEGTLPRRASSHT
jgi:hypothetical protein